MGFPSQRIWFTVGVVALPLTLAGISLLGFSPSALAAARAIPSVWAAENVAVAAPALHNPGFDNQDWYEFNLRYQSAYPSGAWLPDDDNNQDNSIPESVRQDWRLWFLDGKDIVETDPEKVYRQSAGSYEALQIRSYGAKDQIAGIYQVIYTTTPCLVYGFQMYGQSRPEGGDRNAVLQVGIDRVGWHPNSSTDPAVHSSFPATTVWGPSHNYKWVYGPLAVTAEAWGSRVTVFTYADAPGGRAHRILWDSGSFWDATPPMIHDPDSLPEPSGVSNLTVITAGTTATVTWTTANDALGQVYYRLVSSPPGPTPPEYPFKVYLPLVMRQVGWQYTLLNRTPGNNHQAVLTGLVSGATYEFIAVSRGLSGGQCVTWRSEVGQFTVP